MKKIPNTDKLLSTGLYATNMICILLATTILSGSFGYVTISFLPLATIFLLLGVVLLNLPLRHTIHSLTKTNPYVKKLILGSLLCLAGFILILFSKTPILWISTVPLIVSGLHLCLLGIDRRRNELRLLAVVCFGYAVVFLFIQTIPAVWYLTQQSSLTLTHIIGILTTTPFSLGPTTSGLGIFLIFFIVLLTSLILTPRKTRKDLRRFCLFLTILCFIWFFYLLMLTYTSYPASDVLSLHPWFFLFCLIPAFGFLLRSQGEKTISEQKPQSKNPTRFLKNGAVWAVGLLFLSTTTITMFSTMGALPTEQQKVLFYGSHMVGTWDIPEYGKYGKDAVGMFGLWPIYLTTLGYDTEILVENTTQFLSAMQASSQNITRYMNLTDYTTVREIGHITETTLDNATIFVVSNLNVSFSEQEQTIIWNFVQEGGSLLVIGDHTNVGGIQNPLNELLAPIGIRYRFDAALPFDEKFKWLTCTQPLYHPITVPLTNLNTLQYGIGASLELSASSVPILIGSSVLSDMGNQSNSDIAYLGDYEYNKGEQLGDVILVAGAYYGEGKVLVFGDTSSFQNSALPFSHPFLQSSFTWLASTQTGTANMLQIGLSLLLLIIAVLIYYISKNNMLSFIWFPVLFCASLLLSTTLNPLLLPSNTSNYPDNIVLIDASHGERFSLESFTDDSVNGLTINLLRNNLLPILLRDFSHETILKSRMLIFNAPTVTFTSEETSFLQSYMTQGGVVILATGYDDKDASLPLLNAFNVDILPTPLGPVPYVEENLSLYQNEPRFVDSWPLSFQQNQTISFYNFSWGDFTYHLVVFIKQGAGGLLVIGDSRYLLDKNLESIYDYWPGNILFLKYLLDEINTMEGK